MFRFLQNSLVTFILGIASCFIILELSYQYNLNKYYIIPACLIISLLIALSRIKANIYLPKLSIKLIKKALNNFTKPFWLRNSDGVILYKNQAFDSIFYENNNFNAQKFINLINPDNKKHIEDELPIGTRTFLGEELMISTNRFVGCLIDKTEYNLLKQELDILSSSQKNLLDSSNFAVAIYDNEAKLKYFNKNFVTFWNFDERWLNQKPSYSEILDNLRIKRKLPEQADFLAFKREQLKLFENRPYDYKELLYIPDGSVIQVTLLPYDFGGLLFSYENITQSLSLQSAYNNLIYVQKTILNNIRDGAAIFDEKGRIKFCNQSYLKLWNFNQSYIESGPHLSEIIDRLKYMLSYPEKKWEEYKSDLLACLLSNDNTKNYINLINGKVIKRVSISLPNNSHLITYSDITEFVIKERKIIENNDLIQENFVFKLNFFNRLIQEIKFPIKNIKELLINIKDNQELLNRVEDLEKITESISDLSSIEFKKNLEVNLFDFNSTVKLIQKDLEAKFCLSNINLKYEFDQDLGMIIADEKRLKNIIYKINFYILEIARSRGIVDIKYSKNIKRDILISIKVFLYNFNLKDINFSLLMMQGFVELNSGKFEAKINNDEINIRCIIPRGSEALSSILYKENLVENV